MGGERNVWAGHESVSSVCILTQKVHGKVGPVCWLPEQLHCGSSWHQVRPAPPASEIFLWNFGVKFDHFCDPIIFCWSSDSWVNVLQSRGECEECNIAVHKWPLIAGTQTWTCSRWRTAASPGLADLRPSQPRPSGRRQLQQCRPPPSLHLHTARQPRLCTTRTLLTSSETGRTGIFNTQTIVFLL